MPEAHQSAIEWLVIISGVLMLSIMTPFILKAFKKKPVQNQLPQDVSQDKKTNEDELKSAPTHQIVETKETTVSGALTNTKSHLWGRMLGAFKGQASVMPMDEIEEILYTADMGSTTVQSLLSSINDTLSRSEKKNVEVLKEALKRKILDILSESNKNEAALIPDRIQWASEGPTVLMVVGVNGAGKTTTIGKLSALLAGQGKRVLVAAGDTFRAAAQSQLKVWTDRAQVEIFAPESITDPSAVAFEAVAKAKAQKYDLVIIDTAGRLHTQVNLMEELKKVKRVMSKISTDAPHNVWIVLDANSGQNALIQAREFNQALNLTGVVLTKMDGTAKGGVVIGLSNELKVPIKIIGIGEKITDMKPFEPNEFVDSIL